MSLPTWPRITAPAVMLLVFGWALCAHARQPAPSDSEVRLAASCTLKARRSYLGEALEQLQRQARVPLRVSDRPDPASGLELAFNVRGRPLHEVTHGLAALLTTPYMRWRWRWIDDGGRQLYQLEHNPSFPDALQRARADAERRFLSDARAVYRAARDGPEGLRRLANLRPHLTKQVGGVSAEILRATQTGKSAPHSRESLRPPA